MDSMFNAMAQPQMQPQPMMNPMGGQMMQTMAHPQMMPPTTSPPMGMSGQHGGPNLHDQMRGGWDHAGARDAFSVQRDAYRTWMQGGQAGDPMQRPQWHDFKMQWQQQHPMGGANPMPVNPGIVPPGMQHPMAINPATAWHPPQAPANMVGPDYGVPNATPAASPFGLPVY